MKSAFSLVMVILCTFPAAAGSLSVTVSGAVPNGAAVAVTICTNGLDAMSCTKGQTKPATTSSLRFSFDDIAPGRYAVAAYQDLNGSGTLERSRLGLPLEPYALSNNAGRGRRPSFDDAAFTLGNGTREIGLRLQSIAHAGAHE